MWSWKLAQLGFDVMQEDPGRRPKVQVVSQCRPLNLPGEKSWPTAKRLRELDWQEQGVGLTRARSQCRPVKTCKSYVCACNCYYAGNYWKNTEEIVKVSDGFGVYLNPGPLGSRARATKPPFYCVPVPVGPVLVLRRQIRDGRQDHSSQRRPEMGPLSRNGNHRWEDRWDRRVCFDRQIVGNENIHS